MRVLSKVVKKAYEGWLSLAVVLVEEIVFAPLVGGLIRWVLCKALQDHLNAIETAFEPAFYLRQSANERRERYVGRNPLLHYVLLGWRLGRSPAAAFDPFFFRRVNPDLPKGVDPFLLHIRNNGSGIPCNEVSDRQEFQQWLPDKDSILTIHHGRGGGSSAFLNLFEEKAWAEGRNVLRLRAVFGSPTLGVVTESWVSTVMDATPAKTFDLVEDLQAFADYCRSKRVTRLVINHVIDRPPQVLDWLKGLSAAIDCPYDMILHDYYALCPRVNMVTGLSEFCDSAPPEMCATCIASDGSDVEGVNPYTWRRNFLGFLGGADNIVVPSADLAERIQRYVPSKAISVWQPENDDLCQPERAPHLGVEEHLRILIIGALSVPKGAHVLQRLAHEAALKRAPVTFTLIGASADSKLLKKAGVRVTGFYNAADLDGLIREANPHVMFLPSIWPETWSFVLTSALRRGLPVAAFDIGAPAERLRQLNRGHIFPLELSRRPSDLLAAFSALRDRWLIK